MTPPLPPPPPPAEPAAPATRRAGRIWRAVGIALAAAALIWVVAPIAGQWSDVRQVLARPSMLAALGVGALAYGLLLWVFMAPAWWWLTRIYGTATPSLPAAAVWCRTQIVKYLPGNVAHYIGRQVLGRRLGLHHAELAAASLLELVSILAAAGLIAVAGLLMSPRAASLLAEGQPGDAAERMWAVLPLLGALVVAGLLLWPIADAVLRRLPRAGRAMEGLPRLSARRSLALLGPAMLVHGLFLAATGCLLWWLTLAALPQGAVAPGLVRIVWVYAVAWAVGTVVPGAPAGAGVREAIITLELAQDLGRPEAALVSLALRLVTTAGDALAFSISMLTPIPAARPAP